MNTTTRSFDAITAEICAILKNPSLSEADMTKLATLGQELAPLHNTPASFRRDAIEEMKVSEGSEALEAYIDFLVEVNTNELASYGFPTPDGKFEAHCEAVERLFARLREIGGEDSEKIMAKIREQQSIASVMGPLGYAYKLAIDTLDDNGKEEESDMLSSVIPMTLIGTMSRFYYMVPSPNFDRAFQAVKANNPLYNTKQAALLS